MTKSKKERIALLVNTLLFMLGAFQYFKEGNITLFIVLAATGLINFSMNFAGETNKSRLNLFVFFLNSMIAFLVARDYYFGGSNYIHFAWMVAGLVYLVATLVLIRKSRKK